jgi:hypothetical protein
VVTIYCTSISVRWYEKYELAYHSLHMRRTIFATSCVCQARRHPQAPLSDLRSTTAQAKAGFVRKCAWVVNRRLTSSFLLRQGSDCTNSFFRLKRCIKTLMSQCSFATAFVSPLLPPSYAMRRTTALSRLLIVNTAYGTGMARGGGAHPAPARQIGGGRRQSAVAAP